MKATPGSTKQTYNKQSTVQIKKYKLKRLLLGDGGASQRVDNHTLSLVLTYSIYNSIRYHCLFWFFIVRNNLYTRRSRITVHRLNYHTMSLLLMVLLEVVYVRTVGAGT